MRDERWEMNDERWEMRDERWEMRDERWGTGPEELLIWGSTYRNKLETRTTISLTGHVLLPLWRDYSPTFPAMISFCDCLDRSFKVESIYPTEESLSFFISVTVVDSSIDDNNKYKYIKSCLQKEVCNFSHFSVTHRNNPKICRYW